MTNRTTATNTALLLVGTLLLLAGGMLYVLYRPETLLLFRVADAMGLLSMIDHWRLSASVWQPATFVVYSLPAGLWSMSYVLIVMTFAETLPSRIKLAALALVPVLGAASELMQAAKLLPGTFDWADLTLYILPLGMIFKTQRTLRSQRLLPLTRSFHEEAKASSQRAAHPVRRLCAVPLGISKKLKKTLSAQCPLC